MEDTPPPEPSTPDWLTPSQMRVVRAAVVALAGAALLLVVVAGLWVLAQVMSAFKHLLLPLATAGVFALVLYPVTRWLIDTTSAPRVVVVGIVVLMLMAVMSLGALIILPMLVEQVVSLYHEGSVLFEYWRARVTARFPAVEDFLQRRMEDGEIDEVLTNGNGLLERVTSFVSILVGMGFVPVFIFFFLLSGPNLHKRLTELTSVLRADVQEEVSYLVEVFVGYVGAFFQGQLIIALIMAVLYSIGFAAIGLEAALVLGLFSGLLNIVPFLGTAVGIVLVLPYAWLGEGGGATLALLAMGVFLTVQLIESWFLTPRIMSDRSGLHPMMVIVSLFFWGTILGGIIGVLLAVPLSAFVATVWHQLRYRYARTVVADYDGHEPVIETLSGASDPPPDSDGS